MWGNFYHDGSNNYYYWHGKGERDMNNHTPVTYQVRMPNFMQAISGSPAYAKFLTDIHGNDLNLKESKLQSLPIIESQCGHYQQMTLSKMVYCSTQDITVMDLVVMGKQEIMVNQYQYHSMTLIGQHH